MYSQQPEYAKAIVENTCTNPEMAAEATQEDAPQQYLKIALIHTTERCQ